MVSLGLYPGNTQPLRTLVSQQNQQPLPQTAVSTQLSPRVFPLTEAAWYRSSPESPSVPSKEGFIAPL